MNADIEYCARIVMQKIKEYKKLADSKGVKIGTIIGNQVNISGQLYSYTVAIDMNCRTGDAVACMLAGQKAVIVGRA